MSEQKSYEQKPFEPKPYDFSRMVNLRGSDNKDATLNIGVYNGNASLAVMVKNVPGGPVFKWNLSRNGMVVLRSKLRKLLVEQHPETHETINLTIYDDKEKKFMPNGCVVIGRNDKNVCYIAVNGQKAERLRFNIRASLNFELQTPLDEVGRSNIGVETIIEQLGADIPYAVLLTSYKREFTGQGVRPNNNSGGGSYQKSVPQEDIFGG